MLGTAGSQIGPAGSGPISGRGNALLDSTFINGDLAGGDSVYFPLVIQVGIFEVDLVVLAVCALHHVVFVDVGDVLLAAAQALGREDLLLRADDVYALFGFADFLLQGPQKLRTA